MGRKALGVDVMTLAVQRMTDLYRAGHRIVVSFSAGKDSGVCLEVCRLAAGETGRLPVEVVMRDEEIMLPGTFEYAERVAAQPDVDFHWLIANQPVLNVFNRALPYFWVFDPLLKPEQWVRQPPDFAETIPGKTIMEMASPARFPPAEGKDLISVVGIRVQESHRRIFAVHGAGGHLTKRDKYGVRRAFPIYDWKDGDVWKAHRNFKWDYNRAYDALFRFGVKPRYLRIAPPTMNAISLDTGLKAAASIWPRWFDRVAARLDGVRTAVQFGSRSIRPLRRHGESWQECYQRTCIQEAPAWIADRAVWVRDRYLRGHRAHARTAFPDVAGCRHCSGGVSMGSWKAICQAMYTGDPFCGKTDAIGLKYVEPEFFRSGAGTWGKGKPNW